MRCWVIVLSITSNAVPAPRTENSSTQRLVPRSNEDRIALHPRMISQPCPGVFRMNRNRISALLFITVGAVLGHIAATGHFTFHRSAGAKRAGRPRRAGGPASQLFRGLEQGEITGHGGPGHSLDGGPGPGGLVGQEAEHRVHHGRRRRLVQHRRLPPGNHGRQDAESRRAGRPGHALHRLLRRGKLHGRPCQLHHRPAPHPDRPDDSRPGGGHGRHAGPGADHRHRPQDAGLRHRPVRQEPPGRPQRVPADRARLRRVLRLPLSPGRHGGPGPSQLSAGAEGQGRTTEHAAHLGDRRGRPDGAAALGQGRQAAHRGRRHAVPGSHEDRGRRDPRARVQVHRQGQGATASRSSSG